MSDTLNVARGLQLPLAAVTTTEAIVGIRGSGKTNTAVVEAEELLEHGQQIVVIDPTDVWWGLKSSKDGTRAGYGVVILGGRHQDLPLGAGDGATIADFVVDEGVSVILSLRHFESKADIRRFITDFALRLYFRKGQGDDPTPVKVFIDEASIVVPQRIMGEEARMVGAIQQLVRQGRSSGIGVSLIDQRPATINKDVLTQLELLVAHRITSPQDRKALVAWVEQHDVQDKGAEFLDTLASLEQGEAWFWSPGWLDLFKRVKVRERRTFDSSRTPKPGERVAAPTRVAEVDLDALKAKLSTSIEKARADDPRELRKQLAQQQQEIRELQRAKAVVDPDAIAKAEQRGREAAMRDFRKILDPELRKLGNRVTSAAAAVANARESSDAVVEYYSKFLQLLTPNESAPTSPSSPRPAPTQTAVTAGHPGGPITRPVLGASTPSHRTVAPREPRAAGSLSRGMQRILDALAELEAYGIRPASRTQVGVIAGYNLSGGAASGYVGDLTDAGLVSIPGAGRLELTAAGRAQANPPSEALTLADVHQRALAKLGTGERKILEFLLSVYPDTLTREQVGEATGYTVSGGAASGYVGKLVTLEFAEIPQPGCLRAGKVLFPDGLR